MEENFIAWMKSFRERHGGSPYEVWNGIVAADGAAIAEAYGAYRSNPKRFPNG